MAWPWRRVQPFGDELGIHSVSSDHLAFFGWGSVFITEAVRGEGVKLIDAKGKPFLKKYHPLADLAPRDIVARAIDREMKRSGSPFVRLDTPNMKGDFPDRFPNVYENCLKRGVDAVKEPIPVVPAAHYSCGGIPTELDCSTKLKGLYACGEVACTGLHGPTVWQVIPCWKQWSWLIVVRKRYVPFWNPAKNQKFPCPDGWMVMFLPRMNEWCSPTT